MRRKISLSLVFLVVFALVLSAVAYSHAAENRLKNAGFEETEGWNTWGKEGWIRDLNSPGERHSGNKSFKVVIKEAKAWDSTIAEQIIKDAPVGSTLEASVWVMVPQKTPLVDTIVYLEIFFIREDGSDLKKLQSIKYNNQAIPEWQKLTISGVIPPGTKDIKYWLVVAPQEEDCSGTVYFDDAQLEMTPSQKPL